MAGFKVAHGANLNNVQGALIFDEAASEKEAKRLYREYVQSTYGYVPAGFQTICYVMPLSELRDPFDEKC